MKDATDSVETADAVMAVAVVDGIMVADAAMVVAMVADAAMVVVVAMVAAVRQFLSNVWRFRDGVNTPSLFLCFLAYSAYISHIYL